MPTLAAAQTRIAPVLEALKNPAAWLMLAFGFSAGLPFLLTGTTLGLWLRQDGQSLTIASFVQWVSLIYGLKFLWAPVMDKVRLPILHSLLGQRRSYMLLSQLGVVAGLCLMAAIGPGGGLGWFITSAALVAFSSASQNAAIDGWRIEQTKTQADEALNPAFYAFGYKIAVLISGSLILIPAEHWGWPTAFFLLAATMIIGITATLIAPRPLDDGTIHAERKTITSLYVEPLKSFFGTHGKSAVLILVTVGLYRLPDYLIGPVALPLYNDTGISNTEIAAMRSTVGLAASFVGIAIGGALILGIGVTRAFWIGALVGPLSNICFAVMATYPGNLNVFGTTLFVDNIANGVAEAAFVAFLTRLCVREFSLTHYALLYSIADFSGKLLKGFAGQIVDGLTPDLGLFGAYQAFFIGTAVMGIPAMLCCLWLARTQAIKPTAS
ncbi:permease [Asticcacaulis sp. SL142]|uniref:AmpG family muropeptide MFS transporter n=1 Tax=Asticcacaulis sp. SL142 TaxID=2995155 RepID=UPI00226C8556|nr:permease [Asticcacaulis sp. SL142]WAC48610.1 permease [Asticcacaulis sp. SL142]